MNNSTYKKLDTTADQSLIWAEGEAVRLWNVYLKEQTQAAFSHAVHFNDFCAYAGGHSFIDSGVKLDSRWAGWRYMSKTAEDMAALGFRAELVAKQAAKEAAGAKRQLYTEI